MPATDYFVGVVFLGLTLGAVVITSETIRRRQFEALTGAHRLVAQGVLVTALFAAAQLVPGALGILTRGTVLACAVGLSALAWLVPASSGKGDEPLHPGAPSGRYSWVLAGLGLTAVGALVVGEFVHVATKPLLGTDLISYDLPIVGRWLQTGSLWHITELFPVAGTHGTYPHNAHLVLLGVLLPFHNDMLVRAATYPYLGLALVAVYGVARELGVPKASAWLAAALFGAVPIVGAIPEVGPPDTIATAMFAGGVLFLVRHETAGRRSDLLLAGLGLGFAAGAKWYYATSVAAVIVLWAIGRVGAGRRLRPALLPVAVVLGLGLASSVFWLLRNLVEAHDPLFPLRVGFLGVTLFDAPPDLNQQHSGFTILDYVGHWSVWRTYFEPAFRQAFAAPGALAGLGAAALVAKVILAWSRRRELAVPDLLALGSAVLAVIYCVTPYSAYGIKDHPSLTFVNTRYAIPAFVLAVPAATAVLVRTPVRYRIAVELVAAMAAFQGVRSATRIVRLGTGAYLLGLAAVAVGLLVGAGVWLWRRRREPVGRHAGGPVALMWSLVAALVAVFVAFPLQRHYNQRRYAGKDATFLWLRSHADSGRRIGLAGSFAFQTVSPAWPAFGSRIGNRVEFVGQRRGGQLTQYHRSREWLRAVRRGRYDLLLVSLDKARFGTTANEPAWARRAGFHPLVRSRWFVLYRVRGG